MNNRKHIVHMLMIGAGLLVLLVLAGVPVGTAWPYALLLACPLMMVAMMAFMGHGSAGHGQGDDRRPANRPADDTPTSAAGEPR